LATKPTPWAGEAQQIQGGAVAGKDEVQRWWDGLTEEERADAIRSRDAGQLSDAMQKSLERAGLIEQGNRKDQTIPDEVNEHLDKQGKGRADGPTDGKMRH
jgi:hypothetical protein